MPRPRFRSPLGRAVAPVLGGLLFFGVLGLVMWGIAALMAGERAQTTTFTPDRLQVGSIVRWSAAIAKDGPLIFPGLGTTEGERTLVLDHDGTNPEKGWVLYYAYPSDRGPGCKVEQVEKTDRFVDCEGRTIAVSDLSPPTAGEFPVIEDRRTLYIDLGDRPGDAPTTIGP